MNGEIKHSGKILHFVVNEREMHIIYCIKPLGFQQIQKN